MSTKLTKASMTLAIAIGAMFSGAAHAAGGTITGMKITPTVTPVNQTYNVVATVGETVNLNILGSGSCSQLVVDKGEGAAPVLISAQLPMTSPVTYQTAGAKQVKVASVAGADDACQGSATGTVFVAAQNAFKPSSFFWGWNGSSTVNGGKVDEKLVSFVGGSGHCDNVHIDFGDGTVINAGPAVFYPSLSYNFQPGLHAYKQAGTFHMKLWDSGATNCGSMEADAHVTALPTTTTTTTTSKATTSTTKATTTTTKTTTTTTHMKPIKKCPVGKPSIDCDNGL